VNHMHMQQNYEKVNVPVLDGGISDDSNLPPRTISAL